MNKISETIYVNGVLPNVGKKISKFTFGDRFRKFVVDKKNRDFIVIIAKSSNKDDIELDEYFRKYWNFKILYI